MSVDHNGGNTLPEITREEHAGLHNAKRVLPIGVAPTDEALNNASLVLTYDASGNLTQIDKTIGSTTYRKTFTWTGSNLTDISVWSQL